MGKKFDPYVSYTMINFKWIKDLNIKNKGLQFLAYQIYFDILIGEYFFQTD